MKTKIAIREINEKRKITPLCLTQINTHIKELEFLEMDKLTIKY